MYGCCTLLLRIFSVNLSRAHQFTSNVSYYLFNPLNVTLYLIIDHPKKLYSILSMLPTGKERLQGQTRTVTVKFLTKLTSYNSL